MVIAIFGESCTGKSTLAERFKHALNAEVYSGKDYLRLNKNELIAKKLFQKKLEEAAAGFHVIYVISEKEHLSLLPETAVRILATADLDTIKERFAKRMHGTLPPPVAAMLEKKHGCFDGEQHDIRVVSGQDDLDEVCAKVLDLVRG